MPWTCITKLEIPLGSTWTPGVRIRKFRKVYWWGLTALIGPTGRPVAMRMGPKKRKGKKIDAWRRQFRACADTPLWTDWPLHLRVWWGRRRNQLCKFFWKSVEGFRSCQIPKNSISHWNRSSPLRHYRAITLTTRVLAELSQVGIMNCVYVK